MNSFKWSMKNSNQQISRSTLKEWKQSNKSWCCFLSTPLKSTNFLLSEIFSFKNRLLSLQTSIRDLVCNFLPVNHSIVFWQRPKCNFLMECNFSKPLEISFQKTLEISFVILVFVQEFSNNPTDDWIRHLRHMRQQPCFRVRRFARFHFQRFALESPKRRPWRLLYGRRPLPNDGRSHFRLYDGVFQMVDTSTKPRRRFSSSRRVQREF